MRFDLRENSLQGLQGTPFLIELDGVKLRRVIAFDTDAETVERLKTSGPDDSLVLYDPAIHGDGRTFYRGMLTEILRGTVTVWGQIESQADLDAQAGRWA